jgi:hypothetical protein
MASMSEEADDYHAIVARLNDRWRVIERVGGASPARRANCRADGVQRSTGDAALFQFENIRTSEGQDLN